jgi:6-phosphogluconolactonase
VTGNTAAQVRQFPDTEALGRAAVEFTVTLAKQRIAAEGRFIVALSGGSSPKQLYAFLGSPPYRDVVPWQQMHFFWVDERCVPPDHPESNYKLAFDAFLSLVPLPAANIHRIKGEEGPVAAAQSYEEDLRNFFIGTGVPEFDLIILGAGEDGHTASLFPGSPALRETSRFAIAVHLEQPKRDRVTITLPVLNHAAQVLFLASGRAKADIISEVIDRNNAKRYPAGLVRPVHGEVTWFIDREAAEKLPGRAQA